MSDPKIYILQHVEFEGPGFIEEWLKNYKREYKIIRLYDGEEFPHHNKEDIAGLVIMGGPMNIYEEEMYPWISPEKAFIRFCIDHQIPTLGVCLGSQFIADALGSDVYNHKYDEVGWFKVRQVYEGSFDSGLDEYKVFHWHGETFDLPKGSVHLFETECCEQQGFQFEEHVIALQFHLELGKGHIKDLEKHIKDGLRKGPYVQKWEEMISVKDERIKENKELLFNILSHLYD